MDRLGDFLTSLRNAYRVGHRRVVVPYASLHERLAEALKQKNYLVDARRVEVKEGPRDQLELELKYIGELPAVAQIRRISKPGRRVYAPVNHLPKVKGMGTVFLSTSQGILADGEARSKGIGGELLCEVLRGGVE